MKTSKLLMIALLAGLGLGCTVQAQEQTNEVLMTWVAVGYTTNGQGKLIETNLTQQALVEKVAHDNNIDPALCEFVYRIEKRDTAVVWRDTGAFISDVYQTEYTFLDVTNATGTVDYLQTLLNDEYHTNAIGATFGIQEKEYNSQGYLIRYSYHGTFNYSLPEDNVVFTGTFTTGARVYEKDPED